MTEAQRLTAGILPLLDWYRDNARRLPWRENPSPYQVWVSEIMLQQTRVAAVLEYYRRFIQALPDVWALAACPQEELLKLWQGLGYYSRARNLQRAAQLLCREYQGEFPRDYRALLSLPGVGEYTAGAIASIAFDLPEPAVDGNVLRVLTRLLGDRADISRPQERQRLRSLLAEQMPRELPGLFNQALMELGALVCLPKGLPHCERCPWGELCLARERELISQLPHKAPKPPRRVEQRQVLLIFHRGRLALRQRPPKGLLASLWELPNQQGEQLPLDEWGIVPLSVESVGRARHVFTHVEWQMSGLAIQAAEATLPPGWVWADRGELAERYPIPSAFSHFLTLAQQRLQEEAYAV